MINNLLQDVHHGNGTQEIFEQNKSVNCLILNSVFFFHLFRGWNLAVLIFLSLFFMIF